MVDLYLALFQDAGRASPPISTLAGTRQHVQYVAIFGIWETKRKSHWLFSCACIFDRKDRKGQC